MDNNLLDDWFTKSQAAAVLQVSEKTIEWLARKGEIRRETRKRPGVRPSPVYSPEDLDRVKKAQVPQVVVMPPPAEAGGVPALAPRVELPSFLQSLVNGADVPLRDKLVHLIGLGEVVERLGRWGLGRGLDQGLLHRPDQAAKNITNGSPTAAFTLHGLFSHVPQTKQGVCL